MSIPNAIAEYFASVNEGILGQSLFIDYMPDPPGDALVVYGLGNPPPAGVKAEEWCSIAVVVRSEDYATGETKIWRLFDLLVYPQLGFIPLLGGTKALAQWTRIPSREDIDESMRHFFAFAVNVRLIIEESTLPDPWIESICRWTESKLPGWVVYRHDWPVRYNRPAVLWRPENESYEPYNRLYLWRRLVAAGHVLGLTPNEQAHAVTILAAHLQHEIKIPGGLHYLTVTSTRNNHRSDAFRDGQLRIEVRAAIKGEEIVAPLMQGIYPRGVITAPVVGWSSAASNVSTAVFRPNEEFDLLSNPGALISKLIGKPNVGR